MFSERWPHSVCAQVGRSINATGGASSAQISALRRQLRSELLKVVSIIGDQLAADDARLLRALNTLHDFGLNVIYALCGGARTAIAVRELLTEAVKETAGMRPLMIDLVGEAEEVFPLEVLPLLNFANFAEPTKTTLKGVVDSATSHFIGFSAVIRRILPGTPIADRMPLSPDPQVRIKFFQNDAVRAAREIELFFKQRKDVDLADGPWPSAALSHTFREEFCRHLWDSNARFSNDPQTPPFSVIHIACHHVSSPPPHPDFLILQFRNSAGNIEIPFIERQFLQLRTALDHSITRPLVFLNACSGAASLDPAKPSSLAKDLLRENYAGFIGTETDVPDTLASEFSQAFYRHWLAGSPLGEAVLSARKELLWQRNPLGLLYTFYANPGLRVRFDSHESETEGVLQIWKRIRRLTARRQYQ